MINLLRAELRRLVEHIDATDTSGPDGSTFDTSNAHALLGDFDPLPGDHPSGLGYMCAADFE
jgi:hypothetical protein